MVPPGSTRTDVSDAGYFAVFVNRAPIPPGKPLRWIARKDESCRPAEGCPDLEYLNSRGVYSTTETRIVLEHVPRIAEDEKETDWHTVTIVFLDPSGRRLGESAFEVSFHLSRERL